MNSRNDTYDNIHTVLTGENIPYVIAGDVWYENYWQFLQNNNSGAFAMYGSVIPVVLVSHDNFDKAVKAFNAQPGNEVFDLATKRSRAYVLGENAIAPMYIETIAKKYIAGKEMWGTVFANPINWVIHQIPEINGILGNLKEWINNEFEVSDKTMFYADYVKQLKHFGDVYSAMLSGSDTLVELMSYHSQSGDTPNVLDIAYVLRTCNDYYANH